jgi:hypothetical protein
MLFDDYLGLHMPKRVSNCIRRNLKYRSRKLWSWRFTSSSMRSVKIGQIKNALHRYHGIHSRNATNGLPSTPMKPPIRTRLIPTCDWAIIRIALHSYIYICLFTVWSTIIPYNLIIGQWTNNWHFCVAHLHVHRQTQSDQGLRCSIYVYILYTRYCSHTQTYIYIYIYRQRSSTTVEEPRIETIETKSVRVWLRRQIWKHSILCVKRFYDKISVAIHKEVDDILDSNVKINTWSSIYIYTWRIQSRMHVQIQGRLRKGDSTHKLSERYKWPALVKIQKVPIANNIDASARSKAACTGSGLGWR